MCGIMTSYNKNIIPKISCGILVVDDAKNPQSVLLARKTTTFAYSYFLSPKFWNGYNTIGSDTAKQQLLQEILAQMTVREQNKLKRAVSIDVGGAFEFFGPEMKTASDTVKQQKWYKYYVHPDVQDRANEVAEKIELPQYMCEGTPYRKKINENIAAHHLDVQRALAKVRDAKSELWEIPKGKISGKELFFNCAVRELAEETHVTQSDISVLDKPMLVTITNEYGVTYYCAYFIAVLTTKSKLHRASGKYIIFDNCIADSDFIPISKLTSMNVFGGKIIQNYINKHFKNLNSK
jgi:ADP-ribose pyrophosphatase YjhB (NUDIX family)